MIECPDVQAKAQEELDEVIGRGRLPNFSDRENLPYIDAIYKETLRCHPVIPLGIPHSPIIDDEYEGMRIPKGSIVLANAWYVPSHLQVLVRLQAPRGMSRDEKEYGPDPDM